MIKKCKSCGFLDLAQNICQLFRIIMNPEEDYCSKHQERSEIKFCEACGNPIVGKSILIPDGDTYHELCFSCDAALYTCAFCKNNKGCDFETNPSPLPKQVQRQFRQGNMITVTTVMNPERIEITCKKNCSCFSPDFGCMKQNDCDCNRMEHVYDLKRED